MSDIISKIHELDEETQSSRKTYNLVREHRRSNNVLRYHTMPPIKPETVGHHSANVAILCILLSDQKPSINLLMAALLHDMHEYKTGDIPANAKWASADLAEALQKLEKSFDSFYIQYPTLTTEESKILKEADMLDLCFKAKEEILMGNTDYRLVLNRGLDFLRKHNPLPATKYMIGELPYGS